MQFKLPFLGLAQVGAWAPLFELLTFLAICSTKILPTQNNIFIHNRTRRTIRTFYITSRSPESISGDRRFPQLIQTVLQSTRIPRNPHHGFTGDQPEGNKQRLNALLICPYFLSLRSFVSIVYACVDINNNRKLVNFRSNIYSLAVQDSLQQ